MTWIAAASAAISAMANIGMGAYKLSQGSPGSDTTGGVMGGVNGILSSLMNIGPGSGNEASMVPNTMLAQAQPDLKPTMMQQAGFAPALQAVPQYGGSQGAPGTSPWVMPVSASGGVPGGTPGTSPWNYQPASYGINAPPGTTLPMAGTPGTPSTMAPYSINAATPATAPGPTGVTPPTPPNPYMSAIGAAAPALSNVMAARIAQNRTTTTKGGQGYSVPFQTAQVAVGGGAPQPRLSPLERYRLMLSGMR